VLTGGCFDLLHLGHITLLEEAKKQGDILVVLLESDTRIQELKGSNRPLHSQQQRAHMLIALKSVDYVILLPEKMSNHDYDKVTKELQPAIIATTKGSQSLQYIEKQAKEIGASVFLVELVQNLSTSKIIEIITKEL
jgi:D-beta-D-heptose 7-phosphate kinase/D-beta-D-heptose 1-phosphate adenosyltransferase